MALEPGSRLGPYEILAPLGAGGMGEVYRARDERLDREVAIKVLPEDLAEDANRLARFEREAKAVASLSHPNILAIHDFGREGTVTFAVTELVDGDTLEELIDEGRVPQRKAIDYCRQIANGLAAAHDKGVVHRDVKPANVIVNREGRVKILDFGLAKLEPLTDDEAPTMAAISGAGTAPGAVLGTVGYMAPEQVRGVEADHRADIFSLGAILYELLSGQRAFRAESAVETMSAILKEDPPELSSTVEHLSSGLEGVVQHCLEKNPEERFQSARDLAFALDSVSRVSQSGLRALEVDLPRQKRRLSWIWAGGLALIALAIGLAAGSRLMQSEPTVPPSFQRLSFRRGAIFSARFAPDSQTVIYGAAWEGEPIELFTTQIGTPGSRPLDLGATDVLSISYAGVLAVNIGRRFVAGFETSGTLARVSLAGGAPRILLENVHEADWGPDGESLAVARLVDGRYRLEFPIGEVLFETDGWIGEMRVSPDGQHVAFVNHPVRGDNVGSVTIVELAGEVTTIEVQGSQGLAWTPDGKEVWVANGRRIRALTLDGGQRLVWSGATTIRLLDIDQEGRVLVAPTTIRREMVGRAPGAEEIGLSWFNWTGPRDLSTDGRTVLFDEGTTGDEEGYWVYLRGTDGSAPVRLGNGVGVALSPDGQQVLVISYPFTEPRLLLLPVGPGEQQEIDVGDIRLQPLAIWLPNGRGFVFAGSREGEGTRLFFKDLESGEIRPVTPPGVELNEPKALSPDGQSVVVRAPDGWLTRYPIAGGEGTPIAGADSEDFPIRFDETGESLYVLQFGGVPSSVFKIDLATGERKLSGELSPADPAGVFDVDKLFMTADGEAYVYSYRRLLSDLYVVEGLD